ncbi:MAG: cobalt transporter, permease protein CbiQ, partial [Nitrospirae bacterium]|nr:cobalt transporter, permease protein CbiQ [Nitrospirota bacterium]
SFKTAGTQEQFRSVRQGLIISKADMSRTGFLDKTLLAIARVAERSFFSEEHARMNGLLQALDVRIKLLSFLFILVLISFIHAPQSLGFLYGASILLAAASRVPLGLFVMRVWLFVPLFSAAVVLPALLNVITPGEPLWVIVALQKSYTWGPYVIPQEIAVTRQGLWSGIVLVSRVAASVSFAVLLTSSSGSSRTCFAQERAGRSIRSRLPMSGDGSRPESVLSSGSPSR